jgi:hypothetical protein
MHGVQGRACRMLQGLGLGSGCFQRFRVGRVLCQQSLGFRVQQGAMYVSAPPPTHLTQRLPASFWLDEDVDRPLTRCSPCQLAMPVGVGGRGKGEEGSAGGSQDRSTATAG